MAAVAYTSWNNGECFEMDGLQQWVRLASGKDRKTNAAQNGKVPATTTTKH